MASDPAERREQRRRWRLANSEKSREYSRRYREANLEKEQERHRRRRAANREQERENQRRYRARIGPDGRRVQHWALNHGIQPEDWAVMWEAQDGRCYLCGDEMAAAKAHIDHDHRCCPKDHSCGYCRRGLACGGCNRLIGLAGDDPDRLRWIASNLELALKLADARLAAKPVQASLLDGDQETGGLQ
jgi:hypothetical protein